MAALRPSPAALRASAPSSPAAASFSISSSLLRLPSPSSLRLPSLKLVPSPRRRRRGALGASMMGRAASSYANALAHVAKSNGTLEVTVEDMEKVERVFADPVVQSFFANPTVMVERKHELVTEIAASSNLQPHTTHFLKILVEMSRIDIIDDIVKEFEARYNQQ